MIIPGIAVPVPIRVVEQSEALAARIHARQYSTYSPNPADPSTYTSDGETSIFDNTPAVVAVVIIFLFVALAVCGLLCCCRRRRRRRQLYIPPNIGSRQAAPHYGGGVPPPDAAVYSYSGPRPRSGPSVWYGGHAVLPTSYLRPAAAAPAPAPAPAPAVPATSQPKPVEEEEPPPPYSKLDEPPPSHSPSNGVYELEDMNRGAGPSRMRSAYIPPRA
ncbi:hypothetical protein QBC46DRAFT_165269 [Diplogelasinospora grovesii]|uniref:Uncharacterized protein n=1 Tax=Diplogelasinospora grovesii TaxID=303347 RepID=A0AAN6NES8_9PEZI|nr:hypothetical protein QBC46DRAFT_165269 [Diplogelasinospora grovesii]